MKTHVTLHYQKNIAYLSFEPEIPNKPPTLDYEVLDELEGCLRKIRSEREQFDAVIVQSGSPKYFIVGANLQALKQVDKDSIIHWVRRGHEVFNALEDLPLPVIAKITYIIFIKNYSWKTFGQNTLLTAFQIFKFSIYRIIN